MMRLTRASTVGAGHQLLGLARLPVGVLVSQAEVTVVVGDDDAVWALLSCWREQVQDKDASGARSMSFNFLSFFLMTPASYVCGCQSSAEEMGTCLFPSPPHPPPRPGECGCSGSSGQAGSCSAFHRLRTKHQRDIKNASELLRHTAAQKSTGDCFCINSVMICTFRGNKTHM